MLNADAAMHEVLPDVDVSYDPTNPFRIVAVLHIFYAEMTDEMLDLADTLPGAIRPRHHDSGCREGAEIRDIVSRRPRAETSRCVCVASNEAAIRAPS